MTSQARGLLMVWTDIPASVETEFNEWYNREHVPDRLNIVPGFVRGRRFVAVSGSPKYVALYETHSSAVFNSQPYLEINRQPDPNSRRFIPLLQHTVKIIGDVRCHAGQGEGSSLALAPLSGNGAAFGEWVRGSLLPDVVRKAGVVAATYAEKNGPIQDKAAASYTRSGDRFIDGLLVIESTGDEGLAAASAALHETVLSQRGGKVAFMPSPCTFKLIYSQHA